MTQAALTKTINITYKEDSGPFILYNVGESADVGIYRNSTSVPMTKMYYKVVDDYTEGEEYDDSDVEYEVWENTSNGSKTVATVGKNQALLLKAYEKKRWSSSNDYARFTFSTGKFKAYGKIGALDGYYSKLASYCYEYMFRGCTSLTQVPELPATTLAYLCYSAMFYGCTSLTTLPENLLPATTLAERCYGSMFKGCTSLTTAPELPATTLASSCYYEMFSGCTKLNHIRALFTTTPGSKYTSNWVNRVASSGTFVKNYLAEWDVTGVDGIPSGWAVELNATHVSWDSLEITADDVNGRKITTVIHYTLTETMLAEDGVTQLQRTITGNVVSDAFEQNTSYTDTITRTITYRDTQSGLTATTTIIQGVWVDTSYTVDLNSQWQESSKNPDSSLYDCYESFSNYHVSNANAIMYITITGYTEFSLYIRSYGESNYDYLVVGNLDATSISRTTSGVKAHTCGNPQSGTTISSYTKVTFSGLDGGEHKIPILYGKDGSSDTGDDKGYIIIEKNQ